MVLEHVFHSETLHAIHIHAVTEILSLQVQKYVTFFFINLLHLQKHIKTRLSIWPKISSYKLLIIKLKSIYTNFIYGTKYK